MNKFGGLLKISLVFCLCTIYGLNASSKTFEKSIKNKDHRITHSSNLDLDKKTKEEIILPTSMDTIPGNCNVGLSCDSAETLNPNTNGATTCMSACNDSVCGVNGCGENVIWFEFTTDEEASNAIITVNGANFTSSMSIYPEACDSTPLVQCLSLPFVLPVSTNTTYFIAIANSGGETGDFELCVETYFSFGECGNADELMITRPDYPNLPPEGPYCPGENVNICYSVNYIIDSTSDPNGNNCQWIQGIVPSIGGGWDLEKSPIEDQGPAGWNWFPEGTVDYNINESIYQLTTNCDGALELTLGGGLGLGDLLPAGWWFVSPGGSPGCIASGDPDDMWGLPGACGSTYTVAFCFDLRVREIEDVDQCTDPCFTDLKVNIFTFADGQTGCWSVNSCAADEPAIFDAFIDCNGLVTTEGTGDETCSGGFAELTVSADDGVSTIIVEAVDNPNVEGEVSGELSFDGSGFLDVGPLINTGTVAEIVIYEAYVPSTNPNSECNGPTIDIEVIVYPEPTYTVDTAYCSIDLKMFTAIISTTGTLSSVSSGTFTNNGNGSWTISNITSGSDLTGTIINEQGCNTQVVISTPSLCSDVCNIDHVVSNIACDDSGTPSDPSDDTFSFDVEVMGSNTDSGWSADDPNGVSGGYGSVVSFGPYDISDGDLSFTITDDGDSGCTTDVSIVAPSTCSEVCDIEYIVSNIECNDNGTPSDPSDDTYSFDIEVNGNNVGSTWISSDPNGTSGSYGSVVSFGPYNIINEGDLSFSITDGVDGLCTTNVMVSATSTCSDVCNISNVVTDIQCSDGGTSSDPSDDTYSFDIEVNGNNVGSTWSSNDPNVTSGSYGSVVSFGPYSIINEGDLSFTITDGVDGLCTTNVMVSAPSTCSDVCNISNVVTDIQCSDGGTSSDPSDDTYSFDIEVSGNNVGSTWISNDPNGTSGGYFDVISFGPYSIINEGDLSFTITDVDDFSCTTSVMVIAPNTCSDVCDIDHIVSNIECNDNGTPSDPSDDTYSFDIEVNGNNVGSTWSSSDLNGTSGSYGSVVNFGPYSIINEGDISFSISDDVDSACFTQVNIIAPTTCSTTSINELDLENKLEVISLFPNPTYQSLSVVCNDQFSKKLDFFLYDQFGKIVLNIELVKEQTNLNVEGLTSGIYFFTVKDNESQVHQGKLIKL